MAKSTKKKNRRLRKQIRKTIGALFMASAVAVAAIPVQDVSAYPLTGAADEKKEAVKVAVKSTVPTLGNEAPASADKYVSTIPRTGDSWVTAKEKIVYTSGDGTFQFVFMKPTQNNPNKVAVILGYNSGVLMESSLTIPEQLEAYKKYTDNTTREGYCLVSKLDEFLHYETLVHKKDENDRLLYRVVNYENETGAPEEKEIHEGELYYYEDGSIAYRVMRGYEKDPETGEDTTTPHYVFYEVEAINTVQYNPCYYEQRSNWEDVPDTDLYYKDTSGNYIQAGDESDHWKINANVAYIGSEVISDDGQGGWVVAGDITTPDQGVFAGQNNITNLTIGNNILGISDYAFYSCATLKNVSLANGLQTIGNGAFAECINMENCEIASNANIKAIGKDAFYNCRSLKSFTIPVGLLALGDSCFENCSNMTSINLGAEGGGQVALKELGNHLFRGCNKLAGIEFPESYEESNLEIDMFQGCNSLQYVKINNSVVNFNVFHKDDTSSPGYPNCKENTWDSFKATVPASFYFEGPADSNIHDTATAQSIAFKYLGQDLYEKIEYEHDVEDAANAKTAKVTYQVNSSNELVKFWIEPDDHPDNVTIPETIGPYGIASIGQGSFTNNCDLIKITIPASVKMIGDNAFKGCHNLETVIFTNAASIQSIGTDAFKTQEASCGHTLKDDDPDTPNVDEGPSLTFVGAMMDNSGNDTVPFMYAMNGVSNINNADQKKIWIKCHSGWPTNLEVQYYFDPITGTGEAQLVGYPKYAMIKDTTSAEKWVANLPYVTSENMSAYKNMVLKATEYYQATDDEKKHLEQPTENEMAIVNSTLHVVVPASVDCIKPGLFSGYVVDTDGEDDSDNSAYWDKEKNYAEAGSETLNKSIPDTDIQTIVLNGVNKIEPYTFKNCTSLREAAVIGATYIDEYAFDGLDDDDGFTPSSGSPTTMQLQTVTLGTNLTDTGRRPFRGCELLTNITCLDSDFVYTNGVLYRNTGNGVEIVECLESRGKQIGSFSVGPEELVNVTSLKEEAFADCDEIGKIDLSTTSISVVPEGCFAETDTLNSVILPDSVKSIESDAFSDSKVRLITIPGTQSYIAQDAFMYGDWVTQPSDREKDPGNTGQHTIIFECVEGTTADRYAQEYWYINPEYGRVYLEHTVYFWDYPNYPDTSTKEIFHKVKVKDGEDAVPPTTTPAHEGHPFTRWTDYTNISRDTDVYPVFGANTYKVEFRDYDGSLIGEIQFVEEGRSATVPADPIREGYTFDKWSMDWNNVTEDRVIVAMYIDNSGDSSRHTVTFYDYNGTTILSQQSVNHGESAVEPKSPTREGYKFVGWVPATFSNVEKDLNIVASYEKYDASKDKDKDGEEDDDDDDKDAKATPTPSVKKYTVSVSGGSGSGSYAAGDIVAINAYFRGEGQSFDKWTTSTAGVGFANNLASSTTFTMPATNVAVTATYKVGGSSTAGGSSNTGTSGGGSTSSGSTNHNGSSVQITKPGISNTGLAGATVSGATDNFVVKVTEDQNATNAVVTALQTRYGDISRIKYWPVDISLYDSTGRTKIADTSGISVNITLPIPDDFIQYAGNNKVAAVSGGVLEDLNTRFTTVDGVPCVNFTASHFSPYVIYVDTANLTAATIDTTPKTGDPIHPKWFLSVGMACISLILFFKRDKAGIPVKTA